MEGFMMTLRETQAAVEGRLSLLYRRLGFQPDCVLRGWPARQIVRGGVLEETERMEVDCPFLQAGAQFFVQELWATLKQADSMDADEVAERLHSVWFRDTPIDEALPVDPRGAQVLSQKRGKWRNATSLPESMARYRFTVLELDCVPMAGLDPARACLNGWPTLDAMREEWEERPGNGFFTTEWAWEAHIAFDLR